MTDVVIHQIKGLPGPLLAKLRNNAAEIAETVKGFLTVKTDVYIGEQWEHLTPAAGHPPLGVYVRLEKTDEEGTLYTAGDILKAAQAIIMWLRKYIPAEFEVAVYAVANRTAHYIYDPKPEEVKTT